MKTPSIILIFLALFLFACSQSDSEIGGGAVEGNTVVAEVEIDSVFKMSTPSSVGETDTVGKAYWYQVVFHKRQEEYYHYENEDGLGCYVNIYPEENGVGYINDILNHSLLMATLFIAPIEAGILISEQVFFVSWGNSDWQTDVAEFKNVCENRGGNYIFEGEGCPGDPPASCSTTVLSLDKSLEETLKQYAEEFKQLCEEHK